MIFAGSTSPPQTFAPPALLLSSLSLRFETIQEGCRCLQEERGGGGGGREGGRLHSHDRAALRARSRSPTHAAKGGDINWGQNREEKGQVPTRAELGGAEVLPERPQAQVMGVLMATSLAVG